MSASGRCRKACFSSEAATQALKVSFSCTQINQSRKTAQPRRCRWFSLTFCLSCHNFFDLFDGLTLLLFTRHEFHLRIVGEQQLSKLLLCRVRPHLILERLQGSPRSTHSNSKHDGIFWQRLRSQSILRYADQTSTPNTARIKQSSTARHKRAHSNEIRHTSTSSCCIASTSSRPSSFRISATLSDSSAQANFAAARATARPCGVSRDPSVSAAEC